MRIRLVRSSTALALCLLCAGRSSLVVAQRGSTDERAPKLIVLLVVDQMRGDYIDRFQQQWSRGLKRLVKQGAWFRQAEYPYYDTVTCAGHSSIGTGTIPAVHGMILNNWWDREARKLVYCTGDESAKTISYGRPVTTAGESPARLRMTTLADELRAQLSPAARIIGFSLKARSVVTLSGRRPSAVAWFDDSGTWVTSTAFSAGPVPVVADFIRRNPVEKDFGKVWDRALPRDQYLFEDPAVGAGPAKGMTNAFPHVVKGGSESADAMYYDQWQSSPMADEYLAHMALDVAEHLKLGTTASTDMIAISFSTLDKVGHDFGPHSHEIQDVLIRLDRTLGDFFEGLDRLVGPANYTVALSADHGVAPMPERSIAAGFDAGRIIPSTFVDQVEQILRKALGPGQHVDYFAHMDLYLAPGVYGTLKAQPAVMETVRAEIRSLAGVREVYTRDELIADRFDDDPIARRAARSFYAPRSGDLVVSTKPYWIIQANGATHGTGYGYDTHVPLLLMGKGIASGEYLTPASPTDIAPTLAFLARITMPYASGRVLIEALERRPARTTQPRRPSDRAEPASRP